MAWSPLVNVNYTSVPGDAGPLGGAKVDAAFAAINNIRRFYIDPADYGTFDPTGVLASDAALQAAVYAAIAANVPVRVPPGIFLLTNPIFCTRPGVIFDCVMIIGAGGGFNAVAAVENYNSLTVFVCNFVNAPAFSLSSARGSKFMDFAILGANVAQIGGVIFPVDTPASYISAGCRNNNGVSTAGAAQYSPYCAIAIDAFNCAVPADGGYPTLGAQYYGSTVNGSSDLLFENITISQFVVGVGHCVSGLGGQSDQTTYRNVKVYNSDTGYTFTQAQSKIVTIEGGLVEYCRQAYDGITYGPGQGCPPYLIRPHNEYCFRSFQFQASFGPLTIDTPYMESVRTVGTFGTAGAASRSGLTFLGGAINLRTIGFGALPPLILESFGPTLLKGVSIGCDAFLSALNFSANGTKISIEDGSIVGTATNNVPPFIGLQALGNGPNATVKDVWVSGNNGFMLTDCDTSSYVLNYAAANRLLTTGQPHSYSNDSSELIFQRTAGGAGFGLVSATVSALTLNSSTATFTAADILMFQVGDVICWKMLPQGPGTTKYTVPALIIPAGGISGSNVTCNFLWETGQYDTVANQTSATSLSIAQVQWAPVNSALTCACNNSTTITTVSPTTILQNGDWVTDGGTYIPANTRVVSGGGTATVVLSRATTGGSQTPALYFGRLYTPTLTASW